MYGTYRCHTRGCPQRRRRVPAGFFSGESILANRKCPERPTRPRSTLKSSYTKVAVAARAPLVRSAARRKRGATRTCNRWTQTRPEELTLRQPIRCVPPRHAPNAECRDGTRCPRPWYALSSSRCASEAGVRA